MPPLKGEVVGGGLTSPCPPTKMLKISKTGKKECEFCGEPIVVGQSYFVINKGGKYAERVGKYHAYYDTRECMTAHANEIYEKKLQGV